MMAISIIATDFHFHGFLVKSNTCLSVSCFVQGVYAPINIVGLIVNVIYLLSMFPCMRKTGIFQGHFGSHEVLTELSKYGNSSITQEIEQNSIWWWWWLSIYNAPKNSMHSILVAPQEDESFEEACCQWALYLMCKSLPCYFNLLYRIRSTFILLTAKCMLGLFVFP